MASIKVSNLYASGANLFLDSESFLDGLTDAELNLNGGMPMEGTSGSGSGSYYTPGLNLQNNLWGLTRNVDVGEPVKYVRPGVQP